MRALGLILVVSLVAPSAWAEDDPWADEAEALASGDSEQEAERPPGPVDFTESAWAPMLLVAGATTLTGILYGGIVTWGTTTLYRQVPQTPGALLFVAFIAAPLVPTVAAGLADFALRPWWEALIVVGAGLLGGGFGVGLGFAGLFLVGPFLPDPQLFTWFAGLVTPIATTVIAASLTAGTLPLAVAFAEEELGWEIPFKRRAPPPQE